MQREVTECSVTSRFFLRRAVDLVGEEEVVEVGIADNSLDTVAVGDRNKGNQRYGYVLSSLILHNKSVGKHMHPLYHCVNGKTRIQFSPS